MARSEARLQFGIWQDGLAGASPHAKLLYCVLLTEPTLNHCGIGRLCPPLWATNAGLSTDETAKALAELCDGMWVLTDETTYEVFVRTLIRNDGVSEQPYMLKGALKEALQTRSRRLREALAAELRRLPPRRPDGVSKAGKPVIYPDPHATADLLDPPVKPRPSQDPPETLFDGAENPPETPRGRGGGRGGGISSSPELNSVGAHSARPAPKRGTRIPDDFAQTRVTPEMVSWARKEFPHVDGRTETEAFVDHFRAAPGQKGVKADWEATWRNWIRRAAQQPHRAAPPRHLAPVPASLPADPDAAFTALRERADARAASRLIGLAYLPTPQPPRDDTPARQWERAEALRFIDQHADAIRAAIAEHGDAAS